MVIWKLELTIWVASPILSTASLPQTLPRGILPNRLLLIADGKKHSQSEISIFRKLFRKSNTLYILPVACHALLYSPEKWPGTQNEISNEIKFARSYKSLFFPISKNDPQLLSDRKSRTIQAKYTVFSAKLIKSVWSNSSLFSLLNFC